MEQILPALEGQLRRFRHNAAALAERHPRLAGNLAAAPAVPDAHVDRLVQGVANLHARSSLALQRAGWQRDEQLLELMSPQQLRPFPACRIGPGTAAPPVVIQAARFCPAGPSAGPALEIDLERLLAVPPVRTVDIYIEGDASFSVALRTALLAGADLCGAGTGPGCGANASASASDRAFGLAGLGGASWRGLPVWPFAPCGLDPAEALLPRPAGDHAGLALLREFFVFPERFNFVRLDLTPFEGLERWTLRLPLATRTTASLLEGVNASHLRAGWSARAGLFAAAAAPILLDGRQAEYLVSVPPELEIFSIDRVQVDGSAEPWSARCVPGASPGNEWRIAFNDGGAAGTVASVNVSCCHRAEVRARPARGRGSRWQLNSLLALEMLPPDGAALRELMATQAMNATPATQAMIAAIKSLTAQPALLGPGRAAPVAGTELRLHIDPAAFAGCGLVLFAQVMDRFFGECAHLNTFTRLVLVNATNGEELSRCKARNAGTVLE